MNTFLELPGSIEARRIVLQSDPEPPVPFVIEWEALAEKQGKITAERLKNARAGDYFALEDRNTMVDTWRKVFAVCDGNDFVLYCKQGLLIDEPSQGVNEGHQSMESLLEEFDETHGFYYRPPLLRRRPAARHQGDVASSVQHSRGGARSRDRANSLPPTLDTRNKEPVSDNQKEPSSALSPVTKERTNTQGSFDNQRIEEDTAEAVNDSPRPSGNLGAKESAGEDEGEPQSFIKPILITPSVGSSPPQLTSRDVEEALDSLALDLPPSDDGGDGLNGGGDKPQPSTINTSEDRLIPSIDNRIEDEQMTRTPSTPPRPPPNPPPNPPEVVESTIPQPAAATANVASTEPALGTTLTSMNEGNGATRDTPASSTAQPVTSAPAVGERVALAGRPYGGVLAQKLSNGAMLVATDYGTWEDVSEVESSRIITADKNERPRIGICVLALAHEAGTHVSGMLLGFDRHQVIFGGQIDSYHAHYPKPKDEFDDAQMRTRGAGAGSVSLSLKSFAFGDIVQLSNPSNPEAAASRKAVVVRIAYKPRVGTVQARRLLLLKEVWCGEGLPPQRSPEFFPGSWCNWERVAIDAANQDMCTRSDGRMSLHQFETLRPDQLQKLEHDFKVLIRLPNAELPKYLRTVQLAVQYAGQNTTPGLDAAMRESAMRAAAAAKQAGKESNNKKKNGNPTTRPPRPPKPPNNSSTSQEASNSKPPVIDMSDGVQVLDIPDDEEPDDTFATGIINETTNDIADKPSRRGDSTVAHATASNGVVGVHTTTGYAIPVVQPLRAPNQRTQVRECEAQVPPKKMHVAQDEAPSSPSCDPKPKKPRNDEEHHMYAPHPLLHQQWNTNGPPQPYDQRQAACWGAPPMPYPWGSMMAYYGWPPPPALPPPMPYHLPHFQPAQWGAAQPPAQMNSNVLPPTPPRVREAAMIAKMKCDVDCMKANLIEAEYKYLHR